MLTDDNLATLVHAVDLGRDTSRWISSYIRLQLSILSSVLQLMLYVTIFNINHGIALFPLQLLFCKFFVVVTVVAGFIVDVPDPSVMRRPPTVQRLSAGLWWLAPLVWSTAGRGSLGRRELRLCVC